MSEGEDIKPAATLAYQIRDPLIVSLPISGLLCTRRPQRDGVGGGVIRSGNRVFKLLARPIDGLPTTFPCDSAWVALAAANELAAHRKCRVEGLLGAAMTAPDIDFG